MAHPLPRKFAFFVETAFCTGGPPTSFVADGYVCYVTGLETTGLVEQTVENENNVYRPRARHDKIATLRNGAFPCGLYLHGHPTAAAEAAAATTYHIAELVRAAIGGMDLGWAAAVVTSGAETTSQIEIAADPGYARGDFVYYKKAGGTGEFYRILSIAAGPPITLTVDRVVHVPIVDRSVNDTLRAVIDCYIHTGATTNPGHASHKTLQAIVQGELEDDVAIAKGIKPTMTVEPITAGEPLMLTFECAVTTFVACDEATQEDFSGAAPLGEHPLVPGRNSGTLAKLADVGAALANVEARGAITIGVGVAYEPNTGANGEEGVHGYVDTLDPATVELMVPFDSDYNAEFRAKVHKHLLVQVGNDTDSVGFYYPELEIGDEPPRNDQGAQTGLTLSLIAHENSVTPSGLTGDDLEKWLSSFHMLLLA